MISITPIKNRKYTNIIDAETQCEQNFEIRSIEFPQFWKKFLPFINLLHD